MKDPFYVPQNATFCVVPSYGGHKKNFACDIVFHDVPGREGALIPFGEFKNFEGSRYFSQTPEWYWVAVAVQQLEAVEEGSYAWRVWQHISNEQLEELKDFEVF